MNAKVTRRGTKKSRAGCTRCKSQHLKCDEKRPNCSRCSRLNAECVYSQALKWSTKHEVSTPAPDLEIQDDGRGQSSYTIYHETLPEPQTAAFFDWSEPAFPMDRFSASQHEDLNGLTTFASPTFEAFSLPNEDSLVISNSLADPSLEPGSTGMEVLARTTSRRSDQSMLNSLGVRGSSAGYQIAPSLRDETYELLSYYFKVVPSSYSMYDGQHNPFRSAVSNSFGRSLAVNLAAQAMAATYLVEIHPKFEAMGERLRKESLVAAEQESRHDFHVLLAMMMSGPTGNWHRREYLGLKAHTTMRKHLEAMLSESGNLDENYSFYHQAMLHWEMYLSYAADPETLIPTSSLIMPFPRPAQKQAIHPWTGVAPETSSIVGSIGRLVRKNRLRCLKQKFVTQIHIRQMAEDLALARDLEAQLLACRHPQPDDVVSTGDEATPNWHVTTIADLHRYLGLLQLYRVFPDLLSDRFSENTTDLLASPSDQSTYHRGATQDDISEWLTSFALEALKLLQDIPSTSGTKDFQLFLLVAFASELVCEADPSPAEADMVEADSSFDQSTTVTKELDISIMRKFVLDRLHALLGAIPPKPVRVCLDIVKETWRRMDSGQQGVYWLDVVIEKGWETILA